jgi:SagB-type dehydrogenase family enzyme
MSLFGVALAAVATALGAWAPSSGAPSMPATASRSQPLPPPRREGTVSLETALRSRRSVREFEGTALTEAQLGQLLWAAQGASADGLRTAPSAGALYPLELYVATASGLAHYEPGTHRLALRLERDPRPELRRAALDQSPVGAAPAVFVIAAVFERTERKYGRARGARYVHMEAGHAAQNLLLEAVALGLGGVPVGAFDDEQVARALALPAGERPLYLIPVGRPRGSPRGRP